MKSLHQNELQKYGQEHLVTFWDSLSADEQEDLSSQIASIDLQQLSELLTQPESGKPHIDAREAVAPPAVTLDDLTKESRAEARRLGEQALRRREVAMILVAGGQGSRLGFEKPKGLFPIGPISHRTLIEMHCDRVLAVSKRFDADIPLYVMTSPATDSETRAYLDANNHCDFPHDKLQVFCQGTMPAVDAQSGKILLASKSQIALSPDGHGGLIKALQSSGILHDAEQRGVKHFFYAQVDNPLAQLCDPELIGHHIVADSQVTTQVVRKRFATEKVGNVVSVDGKVQIIEYSDLDDAVAEETNDDGSLKLWAGNIAIHIFDAQFLNSVTTAGNELPFHRAHKKVSYIDTTGEPITPETPNATKFEKFVFDLLPKADRALVVEADPSQVFAPVKNADGNPTDTPSHTKQALLALHQSWLTNAGVTIEEGCRVEIHPGWALDEEQVRERVTESFVVSADTFLS